MIDYSKTKAGDRLKIVGMGAPGFANLGDIVTVTSCNGTNRCDVVNENGDSAYFALTCGAQRLELVEPVYMHVLKTTCNEGEHDWSGPGYERETPGGGSEGGATCAKCGMEFGHFALHTFD